MELIEKWGTGINRIKSLCIEKGLNEPIFSEKNDFIDIEFIREIKSPKITTQETTQETTKDKIIQLLKVNPKYTKQDLMKILNKGDSAIKEHLFNLKKEGLIKRFGSTKSGHWEVLDD